MNPTQVTIEAPAPSGPSAPPELIAGKFKDNAELLKAYKELEAKLGSKPTETPAPSAAPAAEAATPTTPATAPAVPETVDLAKYEAEFTEKGQLSAESYAELAKKGITQQQVSDYIAGRTSAANEIIAAAGGAEKFNAMRQWATANMKPEEIKAYNEAVNSNNKYVAQLAVKDLAERFTKAYGTDPNLVGGKPASGTVRYASQAEMLRDMADPRYNTDEAFRQKVYARIQATNV
jgi:hypothetical protein